MELYKIILHSCEAVDFVVVTFALQKVMNWEFIRAYQFCQEADQNGTSVLCIASSQKAHDYILELEEEGGLLVEQVPI